MANPINTFDVVKKLIAWGERAEKQGLNLSRDLQPSIDDPEQMMRIVECMVGNSMAAQALSPVYDVRRVDALFSLDYSQEFLIAFGPPPDALPGFLTFFDPGWHLLRLRKFCKDRGRIFANLAWYEDEAFAKETNEPRYRQIRMEAVEDSFNKNFDEQQTLLLVHEEVPSARVVCMGMVIHFLQSGQRLFEHYCVRCADRQSDGYCINVGSFRANGFSVSSDFGAYGNGGIGLASSRKF